MKLSKIKQEIPIAKPVFIKPPDIYNYCRECNNLFLAKPENKHTMAYYRCEACRKGFLKKSIMNSCQIS
jgi:hypothetical protein